MRLATWLRRTSTPAISKSGKNCLELSGERIDDSVPGSSCALHNAVRDTLARLRSALRHVSCGVDGTRLNAANCSRDWVAGSPIRVPKAPSTFRPQGSCECCDFVQEGYPRHPKGALLAKQLRNVN